MPDVEEHLTALLAAGGSAAASGQAAVVVEKMASLLLSRTNEPTNPCAADAMWRLARALRALDPSESSSPIAALCAPREADDKASDEEYLLPALDWPKESTGAAFFLFAVHPGGSFVAHVAAGWTCLLLGVFCASRLPSMRETTGLDTSLQSLGTHGLSVT